MKFKLTKVYYIEVQQNLWNGLWHTYVGNSIYGLMQTRLYYDQR
jgi:hypothetical protein